ncbi:MAG: ABC transporter permease [Anaerolineales bacterium]|nr:ABC transporter permease [Anaerolineales bacterium]
MREISNNGGEITKHRTGSFLERSFRSFINASESGVFLAMSAFFIIMAVISPSFRSPYNITVILKQISVASILGMGQTLVIISGAFDLSQGSIAGLGSMIAAIAWQHWGLDPIAAICVGLLVGISCGFLNGVLAARLRLHPFVMTLATSTAFKGLSFFASRGDPVTGLPDSFLWMGKGSLGILPAPVLVMLIVTVIMQNILTKTLFGRRALMIGGNIDVAYALGLDINRIRIIIYTISGFLAALGGIVAVGRTGASIPSIGQDLLFPVVTATIIGGTLLSGGVGSMLGTLIGAAIMGIVRNSLAILQIDIFLQDVVQGLLVVAALIIDQFRRGQLTWKKIIGKDR